MLKKLKATANSIPWVKALYRRAKDARTSVLLHFRNEERIFTEIYKSNYWRGKESVSGSGSDSGQTLSIRLAIPTLVRKLQARSVLDAPCGDFNWMKDVDLSGVDYVGADIVKEVVENNVSLYANERRSFTKLNILTDPLPDADLVICRDCLVHFSYEDAFKALQNICATNARFLLTTTFAGRSANIDIQTGRWRPINLQAPPFNFPPPTDIIDEACTEHDGLYNDKSLALWPVESIRGLLADSGKILPAP